MLTDWQYTLSCSMNGKNRSRCNPCKYKSSGERFDVATTIQSFFHNEVNKRCSNRASATSVTWNSSKQIKRPFWTIFETTASNIMSPLILFVFSWGWCWWVFPCMEYCCCWICWRAMCICWWACNMKVWKCIFCRCDDQGLESWLSSSNEA